VVRQPADPPDRWPVVEIRVGSDLTACHAHEIDEAVAEALLLAPAEVWLCLGAVQRFDTAGIGVLVHAHERCRTANAHLVALGAPRLLVGVLHRLRLARVLDVRT